MSASTAGSLLAGRYQLEVPLDRGGFGQVWRARDVATRRPVAVKLVELTEITDPALLGETIGRFRREATTVAALKHPNIVSAYDAGRVRGELFLVMELAEGASLAAVLARRAAGGMGPFPVASVLDIVEQACMGLDAAHAVGVVHRDIKPGNLMVAARLHVKIIDFGIARLLADNSPRLTLPGLALGTAEYMSPEQVEGGDVDGRADLYSLGCVLYELLAGVPPFTAADPSEVLMMQLTAQAVPLGSRRAGLPAGLPELVDDLMAKDRAARPADARQVIARIGAIRAALEAIGADRAGPAHEADRATVLKPDLLAEPTGDDARAGGDDDDEDPVVYGQTVTWLPPRTGAAGPKDAVPAWPQPSKRRARHRRLRTVVSTLITAAIVAGAGAYAWAHLHRPPLKVIDVVVTARSPGTQCDVTVDVMGTIFTNGNGGQVSYQWSLNGDPAAPVATITVASGQSSAPVQLPVNFRGPGTQPATAELRVLSPDLEAGQSRFTYACAR
jgi:serine/threonine-protein kinase